MADSRPNVLCICTDHQRYDTIHALGNPHIRTPNLDRLVATGVAFTSAYCQNPLCTPSRACFLTGCYPSALRATRNGNAYFGASERLITRRLADVGYDCGLVGKLHLSAAQGRVEVRPDDGYRVFKWSHHPYPEECWPTEQHDYQLWLREQGVHWDQAYGGEYNGIETRYHQTTWCANEAIAFMSEQRDGPWLMSVNPFDPHPPFDPPPEYMARMDVDAMPLPLFRPSELESQLAFDGIVHHTRVPKDPANYDARRMIAAYYAQIELIDSQVGRMLDTLAATGQKDDTIVIFTSDHGGMVGDHALLKKGCRFYEGAVHVPLIVSWPGRFRAGHQNDALVELTDIVPTLYEALGMQIPDFVQGKSFLPLLTGQNATEVHRRFVRSEYHDSLHPHCVRPRYDDALHWPYHCHANMIFDGRFKLAVYHGHSVGELYDLQQDPQEFENLWDDSGMAGTKAALIKLVFDAVMLATDDGQPRVGMY